MKQKVKRRIFIILAFSSCILSGMPQSWQWAQQIGSSEYDWVIGNCDKDGNVYVGGSYEGGSCKFSGTTLYKGQNDYSAIFLAKYNSAGEMQWVKQIATGAGEYSAPGFNDIITDHDGFVYVTGGFSRPATFGSFVLQSKGMLDIFIAKYSPDGTCIWAKSAGSSKDDMGKALALDSVNNVYLAGWNNETALFDTISILSGGFIAKYNSSGGCNLSKKITEYNSGWQGPDFIITGLTINKNKLIAFGWTRNDTVTIDTTQIEYDGIPLCCFDLDANIQWVKGGVGQGWSGLNLVTDTIGNIFITGYFQDSINFNGTKMYSIKQHRRDAYLCKYSPLGTLLWARQSHTSVEGWGMGIMPDAEGNCYTTGYFSGTAFPEIENITSESAQDLFLAKYDPEGNLIGVNHFGKAQGKRVGMDEDSNPYVIGEFFDDVEIGATSLSSYGDWDIFIASSDKITNFVQPKYQEEDHLVISANPTTGKCNITIPDDFINEKSLTLTIYDNQGKVIYSTTFNLSEDKIRLNLSAYADGIYTALLRNGKKSYTGRIVFAGR